MSQGVCGRKGQMSSFHSEAGSSEVRDLGLEYLSDRVSDCVSDHGVGRRVDRVNARERRRRYLTVWKILGCLFVRDGGG